VTLPSTVEDGRPSESSPRQFRIRLFVIGFGCLVAVAALLALVPAVPATWASLRYCHGITAEAFPNGYITVTSCSRGSLAVDWTCRGTFRVNDLMAEPAPSGPLPGVVLANDFHHHSTGARVQSALRPGTRRAYLWGDSSVAGKVIGRIVGAGLCLLGLGLAWAHRRRRPWWLSPTSAVIGALLVALTL
jgi:MYXO-CTERM domain-containing protein